MAQKTSQKQEEILLRRDEVRRLRARGSSERKIAEELQITRPIVHVDLKALTKQAEVNISLFTEHKLPHEAVAIYFNVVILKMLENRRRGFYSYFMPIGLRNALILANSIRLG